MKPIAFRSDHCHISRRNMLFRSGFTLIEMLVVISIISVLAALLIPSVQMARESARRTSCVNNIRQIALAVHSHENALGYFPSSFKAPQNSDINEGSVDGWSAHVMLLPFLENQLIKDRIDLNSTFDENFAPIVDVKDGSKPISAVRVPTYLCPSELRDEVRIENATPRHYPVNYVFNLGVWSIFDPVTGDGGNGAFFPNSQLQSKDFRDGLSNTLMAAEVKAWQPYFRNAALSTDPGLPSTVSDVCSFGGAEFKTESGHTEWVDGRTHQTGFTTTFPPDAKVHCSVEGKDYDIDWTNQQEGKSASISTYAAVTSRSYHASVVNVAMMDGAVKPISDSIELQVWRSISLRNQDE